MIKWCLKLNCLDRFVFFLQTCSFLLHKMLTDGLDCSGADYCDVWTLILTAPIHWRDLSNEQVMLFLQICSHKETNTSISWMSWWWNFQQFFFCFFYVKHFFKVWYGVLTWLSVAVSQVLNDSDDKPRQHHLRHEQQISRDWWHILTRF